MTSATPPEFAIVGHPNEGKSSVVATLAEDDSVRISPVPGETVVCQYFPVMIDKQPVIVFVDTPGFQNPRRTLQWMQAYQGPDTRLLEDFYREHQDDPDFQDECELLNPVRRGAGIIYVVDGARPLRRDDTAEMEILRLTGRPRLAILNCKDQETRYLESWKNAFRKHFNAVRVFNAHKATYAERIALLETLKNIDQDWQKPLGQVISAFVTDWRQRNRSTARIICDLLEQCLSFNLRKNVATATVDDNLRKRLQASYTQEITRLEQSQHQKIRKLFKHNIFNYTLPPQSILHEEIFSALTWQFLGLTPRQLISAGALMGGALGAAVDVAAAGLTFGIFAALGGLGGAGYALLQGPRMARTRIRGIPLGGRQITIGPHLNLQFMFILLDRALIFYSHVINWAHGRQATEQAPPAPSEPAKAGFATEWDQDTRKVCQEYLKSLDGKNADAYQSARLRMETMLEGLLQRIGETEWRYGLVLKQAV